MKYILGEKKEMTQFFAEDGFVIPATIVSVDKNFVTQVKTIETDGYNAVQIASKNRKEKNVKKPQRGHFKELGLFHYVKEFTYPRSEKIEAKVGDEIDVSIFEVGDKIQVSGVSKGKGFQGVVKRHNFSGAPSSHGHRHDTRKPGSIGATGPARVFKGTRMAGRMGHDRITVKNLKIMAVDLERGLILVKGAVPGRRGTLLEILKK